MKRQTIVIAVLVVLLILTFLLMGAQQKAFPGVIDLQSRVRQDLANEKKRFLPQNSVDISMAMKLITHDAPNMLAPPPAQPPLLMFPPSEETLERLSGK
jgi:hypothetical protein